MPRRSRPFRARTDEHRSDRRRPRTPVRYPPAAQNPAHRQRHVVAAGDRVMFRPAPGGEGIIERIEPRHRILSRATRGRQHVIVANVDQLLIVASAAEPYLKPNLIDRFLVSAEKNKIRPLIVINKTDLVDRATLEPLVGVYSQMGYRVLLARARRASESIACAATSGLRVGRRRPERRWQVIVAERRRVGLEFARGTSQRRDRERAPHDDHGPVAAIGRRRLRRRYARHSPVSIVGRRARGSGRLLPRHQTLRAQMPLSRLHPHARGGLRSERCRGRRLARRPAIRELLPPVRRRSGRMI